MIPRILFVTCLPLEAPRSASMAFMSVLLHKYPDSFVWFSLRPQDPGAENPYDIPYAFTNHLSHPARFPSLRQYINLFHWAKYLGYKAAHFGQSQNVQIVLADAAFEAVVAGRIAAKKLGIPLLVSVHDDPINRIRVKNYPDWLIKRYEKEFAKTLRSALRCGVISDYMGEIYQERYGVKTMTLFIGVDEEQCLNPVPMQPDKAEIIIGSIGSMNSIENWTLLIESVKLLNGKYGNKKFRIQHIGDLADNLTRNEDVEVTGWIPETDFLNHLSSIDLGFLNFSFTPRNAETGGLSFPLKIHSYIQAQKPMFALGPADSSAVRFVRDFNCGEICTENNPEAVTKQLGSLVFDNKKYNESLEGVRKLKDRFSRENFFDAFEMFIDLKSND